MSTSTDRARGRVCIFCGSSMGFPERYRKASVLTAQVLVRRGYSLVYGGGLVGLMGVVADTVLEAGGDVLGVIPDFLALKEIMHPGVTQLHRVPSMHIRKAMMADHAEMFVALPGGWGTYDELCEIVTWAQLGLHRKPIGVLNVDGFFDGLIQQVDRAVTDGFCRPEHRELMVVETDPERLFDALERYEPPPLPKWLEPGET